MRDLPPVSRYCFHVNDILTLWQEPVQFKIEPILIPAANIARDGKFPDCKGGFCDIWKCSMTTQSGTRRLVSLDMGKRFLIYHSQGRCQIYQGPFSNRYDKIESVRKS